MRGSAAMRSILKLCWTSNVPSAFSGGVGGTRGNSARTAVAKRAKHEARSTKHETNFNDRKKECSKQKRLFVSCFEFMALNLFRISCFGFRISEPPVVHFALLMHLTIAVGAASGYSRGERFSLAGATG